MAQFMRKPVPPTSSEPLHAPADEPIAPTSEAFDGQKEPVIEAKAVGNDPEQGPGHISRFSYKSFAQRHKKLVSALTILLIILAIALGAGIGVGKRGKHKTVHFSHSSGSSGSGGSTCTPPGGQMCESSGDCAVISAFSSCIMACDGFSYCT